MLRTGAALLACCAGLLACGPADVAGPSGRAAATVTAADFARWESELLRHGRLRTDRRPADAPVSNAALVDHFGRVAFGLEAAANRGRGSQRLRRREGPVRWWVDARGAEAGAAAADVAATFGRFAALTGLDAAPAAGAGSANFHLLFLGPQDYARAVDWARRALGRDDARLIADFRTRRTLCTASTDTRRGRERTLVLVRAGYSDLLRLGCVQEEVAQALGLPNDDPGVRPSVFNDDEEFALLTEHDEMLLRILYDPRLRSGMTRAEAAPVVARIVQEMRPGG